MRGFDGRLGLALLAIMGVVLAAGCSSSSAPGEEPGPAQANPGGLVRSSSGGAVTIEATWLQAREDALVFDVTMDTHSANLDAYDLSQLSLLRDDEGKEYRPTSWVSASGGHHRTGILTFPTPDSLSQRKASYMELVIKDVAGVEERILTWELGR